MAVVARAATRMELSSPLARCASIARAVFTCYGTTMSHSRRSRLTGDPGCGASARGLSGARAGQIDCRGWSEPGHGEPDHRGDCIHPSACGQRVPMGVTLPRDPSGPWTRRRPRGVAEKLERPGKVGRSEPMEAGFTGGLPRICRGPRNSGHPIPVHIPERHFSAGLLGACRTAVVVLHPHP